MSLLAPRRHCPQFVTGILLSEQNILDLGSGRLFLSLGGGLGQGGGVVGGSPPRREPGAPLHFVSLFFGPISHNPFQIIDLRFLGCMGRRSREKGEWLGFGKHDGGGCSILYFEKDGFPQGSP